MEENYRKLRKLISKATFVVPSDRLPAEALSLDSRG